MVDVCLEGLKVFDIETTVKYGEDTPQTIVMMCDAITKFLSKARDYAYIGCIFADNIQRSNLLGDDIPFVDTNPCQYMYGQGLYLINYEDPKVNYNKSGIDLKLKIQSQGLELKYKNFKTYCKEDEKAEQLFKEYLETRAEIIPRAYNISRNSGISCRKIHDLPLSEIKVVALDIIIPE